MDGLFQVWKRTILVLLVLMTTSVDEGEFVYSAAASDWSLSPVEEYVTAWINLTYMDGDKLHTEKTEIGKFGTGKVGPASGVVVHVTSLHRDESHFGCDFPYGNQLPNEPWIALVKRGNCTFDEKLRNAYRSNASALVVYAKEDKDTLDRMSFKDCSYCNIPTVFTYRWKGEEIAKHVDRGTRVYMYITVGETCARPYSGINRTSVLFVSISFIVLMIISLAWLVFYYVQRFRYLHAKDRLAQRLCNAAKKALAKIPTRNIKLTDKEISGEGECCAVCIELYRSGETLRTLPCRHEFHKSCVDPWLLEHRTCPMCKMDILKYYGFIFSGSQESILHLDMEEGGLNSSESREMDTPTQETRHHHQLTSGHSLATTTTAIREQPSLPATPEATLASSSERKPSLISLTFLSTPKGCKDDATSKSPSGPDSPLEKSSSDSVSNHQEFIEDFVTSSPDDHNPQCEGYVGSPSKSSSLFQVSEPLLPSLPEPQDSRHSVPVTIHQFGSESRILSPEDNAPPRSQPSESIGEEVTSSTSLTKTP